MSVSSLSVTEAVTPPNPAGPRESGPTRATPDPTLLTIDSIRREIAMLENLTDVRIDAGEELTVERFHRVDQAVAKMEKSISDQVASLRHNFETEIRSVTSAVADLKDRLTILESVKVGQVEQKSESRQVTAGVYAAIATATSLILVALAIFGFAIGGA